MAKSIRKFLKSFTLIELIIVIAIIAVLGATAFLLLTQWMSKGRDAQRISDLSTIKTALDIALAKYDELPLPDEANVLLYSGTEILHQGKFGDHVVKQIGTLNKLPKDRVNGEYDYSILDDMKTYRIRAQIENEQYKMTYVNKVSANDGYYRYIGKDTKGVVIENNFIYLPSMFVTGYAGNKLDIKDDNPIFEGEKPGQELTGLVLENNNDKIISALTSLGFSTNEASLILSQAKGVFIQTNTQQPAPEKCEGILPANAQLNGTEKGGINWSYGEIVGDCKFICNDGYHFLGGNCEIIRTWTGDVNNGFVYNQGISQVYPKSCKDLLDSTNPNFKVGTTGAYNGTKFIDGIYWIKPDTNQAMKAYCDMTTDGGGWSMIFAALDIQPTVNRKLNSTSSLPLSMNVDSNGISTKLGSSHTDIMFSCLNTTNNRLNFKISDSSFINTFLTKLELAPSSNGHNIYVGSIYTLSPNSMTDLNSGIRYTAPAESQRNYFGVLLRYDFNTSTQNGMFFLNHRNATIGSVVAWGRQTWSAGTGLFCSSSGVVPTSAGKQFNIFVR